MADPTTVANLVLWFRASDLSGLADGTAISTQWSSFVGGSTTNQVTAGARPTKETVGSDTVVRFDGTDDLLRVNDGAALTATQNKTAITLFVKAKVNSAPAATGLLFMFSTAVAGTIRVYAGVEATTTNQRVSGRRLDADAAVSFSGTLAWGTTDVHVQTQLVDWGNADHSVYRDGVLSGSNTSWLTAGLTSNTASADARFGAQNGSSGFAACDIYDVLTYDRLLNSTEQATVENYLLGVADAGAAPTLRVVRSNLRF